MTDEQKSVHYIEVLNGEIVKKINSLTTKIENIEEKFNTLSYPSNKESVARDQILLRDLREARDYVSMVQDRVGQLQESLDEIGEIISDANNKLVNIIFPLEDKIKKKER